MLRYYGQCVEVLRTKPVSKKMKNRWQGWREGGFIRTEADGERKGKKNFVGGKEGKFLYGGASEEATSRQAECVGCRWTCSEPAVGASLSLGMEGPAPLPLYGTSAESSLARRTELPLCLLDPSGAASRLLLVAIYSLRCDTAHTGQILTPECTKKKGKE